MAGSALIYAASLASDLPVGWSVGRFEDMVFYQEGPGIRNWQYVDEGVPFVNIRCLVDGKLVRSTMNKVSNDEAFGKYSHFLLQAEDFVVSSSGTLGRIATVRPEDLPCMLNTSIIRMRPKTEAIDRGFLKYFLHSSYYQKQILSFATGSAQLNYGPSHLKQMFIVVPPLPEQQAIASILGALDDKIDLNRRMNETLESMARAIFKSWFVDFDPVRAKMEGKQPYGMDAETAALFPSSFDDDALPAGWANGKLGDFVEIQNGYAFKSEDWTDEGVPVVKIGSVKPSVIDLSKSSFVSAEIADQKQKFELGVGDILVGLTGYVGEVGRVPPSDIMPMLNQRVGRVVFKSETFEPFVYTAMRLPEFKSFAEIQSQGTAQANVSTKQLKGFPLIIADNYLIEKFNALTGSYFEKVLINFAESKSLAELRNLLLPKLLSGEIRVKEAEQMVEAAV